MSNQTSREVFYFKVPVFIADLTLHLLVLFGLLHLLPERSLAEIVHSDHLPVTIYVLLVMAFSTSIGLHGLKLHERRIKALKVIWRAIVQTVTTWGIFIVLISLVYKATPRDLFLHQIITVTPLIVFCHFMANKAVRWLRHLGHNTRNVVIVGADETTMQLYDELMMGHSFTGFKVSGFFTSKEETELPEGAEMLGKVGDCYDWIVENHPDEVYCSLPPEKCSKEVNKIIQICNDNFIEFFFVPTFDGYPKRQLSVRSIGKVNYMKLREEPLHSPVAKFIKRSFDLVVSGLFLCTLYPFVVLFVWIGNKLTGNVGPLYFRQARTGYNGQCFYIYKFRSMKVNADADKLQATKDDPRKTPFGDFLRKSSIDELPQFINVFKGDMSIIGPRPHMEYHTEVYSALISDYMVRHLAKPGITGWAQINGCRGETKTVEEMQARVEHDIWYIENYSPLLDIEIFFRTMWQVIPGHDKQAY